MLNGCVFSVTKKRANEVLKEFRGSIEQGRVTPALKPSTIAQKKRLGYSKPTFPLRGLGADGPHTYLRSMRLYKIKNGWKVQMPAVPHHKSKLNLKRLFEIQEYGAVLGSGKRIPPRPALANAYKKVLSKMGDGDVKAVQAALAKYIATGDVRKINEIIGGK
jgi:hypothetical protein